MASSTFQDESTDCAICLEPLEEEEEEDEIEVIDKKTNNENDDQTRNENKSSSQLAQPPKVLTLSCGHKWHYECLIQQLQTSQAMTTTTGKRLLFTGCQCAKCGQICDHPLLEHLTRATDTLRITVDILVEEQIQMDDTFKEIWKHSCETNDEQMKVKIRNDAKRKYAFYLCTHCREPYFGGTVECADLGIDEDADSATPTSRRRTQPEQRLCNACAPQTQTICENPNEHGQYLIWKCRYCCQPSTHICYGNIHFCNDCHVRNSKRVHEIQHRQRQQGRNGSVVKPPPLKALPCSGASCPYPKLPNRIFHINGHDQIQCEQVYSCAFCESNIEARNLSQQQLEQPGSSNFIRNSSGQQGLQHWIQLSQYQSWKVEQSELPVNANTRTNFVSSYSPCMMMQSINLSNILNLRPNNNNNNNNNNEQSSRPILIEVSARYIGRTDCPSIFRMEAVLGWLSNNNSDTTGRQRHQQSPAVVSHVIQRESTSTLETPPDYWETSRLELQIESLSRLLESNLSDTHSLVVQVVVMGKDRRFWQGNFGSKVTNISVRILGTQEELETILTSEAIQQQQQQYEDENEGQEQQQLRQVQEQQQTGATQQQQHHQQVRNLPRAAVVKRNHENIQQQPPVMMTRLFWDVLIPVACFFIFTWLAKD